MKACAAEPRRLKKKYDLRKRFTIYEVDKKEKLAKSNWQKTITILITINYNLITTLRQAQCDRLIAIDYKNEKMI